MASRCSFTRYSTEWKLCDVTVLLRRLNYGLRRPLLGLFSSSFVQSSGLILKITQGSAFHEKRAFSKTSGGTLVRAAAEGCAPGQGGNWGCRPFASQSLVCYERVEACRASASQSLPTTHSQEANIALTERTLTLDYCVRPLT